MTDLTGRLFYLNTYKLLIGCVLFICWDSRKRVWNHLVPVTVAAWVFPSSRGLEAKKHNGFLFQCMKFISCWSVTNTGLVWLINDNQKVPYFPDFPFTNVFFLQWWLAAYSQPMKTVLNMLQKCSPGDDVTEIWIIWDLSMYWDDWWVYSSFILTTKAFTVFMFCITLKLSMSAIWF